MEDIYEAIIGEPTSNVERLAMIAKKLRKAQLLGQLGQVTGDRVLAPMGQDMTNTANLQAENIGRRGETARYRQYQEKQSADSLAQRAAEQAWQEKYQSGQLGLQRAQLAQQRELAELNRSALLERAKIAAAAKERPSAGALKLSSQAMQRALSSDRVAATATRLKEAMPETAVRQNMDVLGGIISRMDPGVGQRFINSQYNREDNKWRSDADLLDQDLSNMAAGLSVTGFELANKQKWSPRAPGISYEEAQDRWDNIHRKFSEAADYAKGEYETLSGSEDVDIDVAIARELAALEELGVDPSGL